MQRNRRQRRKIILIAAAVLLVAAVIASRTWYADHDVRDRLPTRGPLAALGL